MATVNFDTSDFEKGLAAIVRNLNANNLLRPVCVELSGLMNNRIHNEGKASDGGQIGQYKDSYLKIRKRYKLSDTDKKVILLLTRKLSNSWTVFATDEGYAVGFIDDAGGGASLPSFARFDSGVTSMDKINFAEHHFGKKIFDMTADETKYAEERTVELSTDLIENAGA